jgi:hypothetical protein
MENSHMKAKRRPVALSALSALSAFSRNTEAPKKEINRQDAKSAKF